MTTRAGALTRDTGGRGAVVDRAFGGDPSGDAAGHRGRARGSDRARFAARRAFRGPALGPALGLAHASLRALGRAALVLAAAVLPGCDGSRDAGAQGPHVVLVTVDTLRADHLSIHGYPRETSPHIDAFARGALRYVDMVTVLPKTGPSMTTHLSGLAPCEHGVTANKLRIPGEVPLVAEAFQSAGWHTTAWISNPVLSPEKGYARGFDDYREFNKEHGLVQLGRRFLKWAGAHDWTRPTFAWLHYIDPHGPYTPPPQVEALFVGDALFEAEARRLPTHYERLEGWPVNYCHGAIPRYQLQGSEDRVAMYVARYDAEIRHMDAIFGQLTGFLRERNLWDTTAIVLTADHGESLGEHDYWFEHGWYAYETTLHVPMIVKPAGEFTPAVIESQVSNLDTAPTLLAAAGLPVPPGLPGRSLLTDPGPRGPLLIQNTSTYPDRYVGLRLPGLKYLREARGGRRAVPLRRRPARGTQPGPRAGRRGRAPRGRPARGARRLPGARRDRGGRARSRGGAPARDAGLLSGPHGGLPTLRGVCFSLRGPCDPPPATTTMRAERKPIDDKAPSPVWVYFTGICMGAADLVPGVSGGTMAFIMGIYDRLVNAITSVDVKLVQNLLRGRLAEALRQVPLLFLACLGAGIVTSVLVLSGQVEWALENRRTLLFAFFFGLVVASVISLAAKIRWNPAALVWAALGCAGAWIIVGLLVHQTPNTPWMAFVAGAIGICAMILPGISGSFLLLILGQYGYVISAINDLKARELGALSTLVPFGLGMVIGIGLFSRVLSWLLDRFYFATVAAMTGFIAGSLRKIWPFKGDVIQTIQKKDELIEVRANALPDFGSQEFLTALGLAVAGFVFITVLDHLHSRANPVMRLIGFRGKPARA